MLEEFNEQSEVYISLCSILSQKHFFMKKIIYCSFVVFFLSCSNSATIEEHAHDLELSFFISDYDRINDYNKIMTYVNINGMDSLLFILDNGATQTIFKQSFFDQYFNTDQKINFGTNKSDHIMRFDIAIGEYLFSIDTVTLTPFMPCGEHCNKNIAGIIGVEFFTDRISQIDFQNNKIRILSSIPNNLSEYEQYNLKVVHDSVQNFFSKFRFLEINDFCDHEGNKITGNILLDLGSPTNMLNNSFYNIIDTACFENSNILAYRFLHSFPTDRKSVV